jgi:hypothetical protein
MRTTFVNRHIAIYTFITMDQCIFMQNKEKLIEGSSEKANRTFLSKQNVMIQIAYCFDYSIEFKKYFFLHKSKSFYCMLSLVGLYIVIHFQ